MLLLHIQVGFAVGGGQQFAVGFIAHGAEDVGFPVDAGAVAGLSRKAEIIFTAVEAFGLIPVHKAFPGGFSVFPGRGINGHRPVSAAFTDLYDHPVVPGLQVI